ncbi:unnamed protein product [Cuscuta campestris]|uniref:Uncharacterized protein n=1 Tax=Cuscuta campestris TaxID=132261 RepID=A0A484MT57_9ASTE|nr:unnamed protein product [Cuscuta campestris]
MTLFHISNRFSLKLLLVYLRYHLKSSMSFHPSPIQTVKLTPNPQFLPHQLVHYRFTSLSMPCLYWESQICICKFHCYRSSTTTHKLS